MTTTAPLPPQNLDAEESVLGAMMLNPIAIERVIEATDLSAGDFYRESHGHIYRAILSLHAKNEPVDAITVTDELSSTGALEKAGGITRVHELAALVPAASNAPHYAKLVTKAAVGRALIRAGNNITRLGYELPGDTLDVFGMAEAELTQAVTHEAQAPAESVADGLDELIAEIREAYLTGVPITGYLTGFRCIDEQLGGLWPGQLVLVAARPSVGKSTLAQNIAENFADRGDPVLFASLEMSKMEMQIRALAREAGVDSKQLQSGQMTEAQAAKLGKAVPIVKAREDTFLIRARGDITIPSLRSEARRLKRLRDLRLIVVDYLQLMEGTGQENRTQEVSTISRGLKLLAQELDIPVLALSQMSRAIEQRSEKRPQLSDLRESGSLEQDADVVLFLHQASDYDPAKEPDGTVELIAAKARKGGTGGMTLAYNRSWSRMGDPAGGGMMP
jgi:replicative DNA helicase